MSDSKGIYRKFNIERADGSSGPGGKHEHCAYFVLDLEHDRFAIPALRAYADACREAYPALAADLDRIVASGPPELGPSSMADHLMTRTP
jgi:hypothetical protein